MGTCDVLLNLSRNISTKTYHGQIQPKKKNYSLKLFSLYAILIAMLR